jgi:hypothetical protein
MGKGIFLLDLPFTALYKNGIYITEFYKCRPEGFQPIPFPVFSFINSRFLMMSGVTAGCLENLHLHRPT